MGIPAQKYLSPEDPPENYKLKSDGFVENGDLVWSTSEAKFFDASVFNAEGEPVDTFWGVAEKATS